MLGLLLLMPLQLANAGTASLPRAGLDVTFDEKQWAQVETADSLGVKPLELFLQNRNDPSRKRMVLTQLSFQKPNGNLCAEGTQKPKSAAQAGNPKLHPKGWNCIARTSGAKPQLLAVRVRSHQVANKTLWAVVSTIEQGKTDAADFDSWLASFLERPRKRR
ncbi:MAG: hypothetical protein A2X94_00175 [Bdellovibrionales bacterium GWB1_55_8]|nr:MAG: hypothetical protein A2X94_00175 [Bdellovibrionales bacterium GWB1_55_8]